MKSTFLTILFAVLLLPRTTLAGDFASITYRGSVDPGGSVSARVTSPFADPGEMGIVWYVDGAVVARNSGIKEQEIQLGEVGVPIKVTAIISYRGAQYKEEISVTPALIDVLWEAKTVVPPFYRGKAMPSHDGVIRTMAIPRFSADDSNEPVFANFTWTKDRVTQIGRGVGAQGAQFLGAWPGRSSEISVKAVSGDRSIDGVVRIGSRIPEALFYEISPSEGLKSNKAFAGTVSRSDNELLVGLVPFGISLSDFNKSRVQYTWKVGGETVSQGDTRDFARLKLSRAKDPSKTGTVKIDANIQSTANVMQSGDGKFLWNFTK